MELMLTIAPPSALLAHPPSGLRAEEHPLDVHGLDAAELLERQAVEEHVGEDAGRC